MAEKLIFPIGFDLEEGVREAQKNWKTYQAQMQKTIDRNPLKVKIELFSKDLNISDLKEYVKLGKEVAQANREIAKTRLENARIAEVEARTAGKTAIQREQQRAATARAEQAELRLANAKNKSADATNRQIAAEKTHLTYIQRLMQRLAGVGGLYQAIGFVTRIREVTAEVELQRVALGAIIKDSYEASKMFEQIKAAAVKSPFEIKDLVSYTKQLAAYKFETKDLFDTTMQLADISAGLGVGMERLVLALGQVRATGHLRASEVRQFTEAGIPLVEELAKKLSEMRGEMVSAGDVMQMISERAISFGMVKEVFDDMTSAGGTFYKMQEKQAETLAGQWSNLKDTLSIMYDEIGRSSFVQGLLQGFIDSTKLLASNWDNVVRVISSVGAGLGVYVVAMKNATIASKALTAAEATRMAVENKQMIIIPKWLAIFDRKNKLYKLSIILEKALTKAQIKTATATNLLSKGFWKLTAAMLSNPYTIAIAGLIALGTAIFAFSTKSKSAEESIEDLNGAVHKLADVKKINPLVDELDALSKKANKTAKEQKRLAQVTTELADRYPAATRGVKEYGNEVEVTAEKVKKLHEAEMLAARRVTEATLKENEKLYEENAKKLAEINEKLASGRELDYSNVRVPGQKPIDRILTDKEIIKLGEETKKLADENIKLGDAIKSAKIELGLMAKESTTAIDSFGSWKEEIKKFNIGLLNLEGKPIQLFDDDTINNFANLLDALERTAELYKKNEEAAKSYSETLESEKISAETKKDIEQRKARAEAERDAAKAVLEHFNALQLLNKKTGKDPRLSDLKKQISDITNAYKKFIELRKYMSKETALGDIAVLFPSLDFEPTYENMVARLEEMRDDIRKELDKSPKDKTLIDMNRELEKALANIRFDELKTNLEQRLARLSDDVAKTKTAKEFYDRILGITGDRQLSATFTMSVYGESGDELAQRMIEQVESAFDGVDIGNAINKSLKTVDLSALQDIYSNLPEDFATEQKKRMKEVISTLEKQQSDVASNFAKLLMDYDEMEQKRVTITQKTAQEIETLEKGLALQIEAIRKNENVTDKNAAIEEAKARAESMRNAILAREELELQKLSPEYISFFTSINAMSIKTANTVRTELRKSLFDAFENGAISAEQLRKELKAIDTQFNKLNKNSSMFSSYMVGGLTGLIEKIRDSADQLFPIAEKMKKFGSLDEMSETDQDFVNKLLGVFGGEGTDSLSAMAESFNGDMEAMGDAVQGVGDKMQGMLVDAAKIISVVDLIITGISQTVSATEQILNQVNSMRSEDNQVGGWFKYVSDFNKYATSGWEKLKSGNFIGALADTASSIISIFQNIQADEIEKIDKDIEYQTKLLGELEYAYGRLEKAMDDAFGSEYVNNYNERLRNLAAQQDAYLKQAQLERDKGKKADEDKIKEYEDAARDAADKIKDMQGELAEYFLGTDLTSAAREFANAWIDAYKDFGNTTEAMKEKFREMIQNMIVESLAAAVMKNALEPVFDMVKEYSPDGISVEEAAKIAEKASLAADDANVGMTNLMNALKQAGIDVRDTAGGLTGISKDIATASEESILGLAAGINTQNFYISQIHANVALITQWVTSGGIATQGVNITDLITLQNQHLSHLPNIAANTAGTLAECKNILAETTRIANRLDSVIKPQGVKASYTLNTSL